MTKKINKADVSYDNQAFRLSGKLDFFNIMSIYQASLDYLAESKNSGSKLNFDFSNLESSDSSGLALIIEWIKYAKKNQLDIHFTAIPNDLLTIAKVAGITETFFSF